MASAQGCDDALVGDVLDGRSPFRGYDGWAHPIHGPLPGLTLGLGGQAHRAIQTQDLPLIMGTVLSAALPDALSNVVVDLAYTWLGPRVKCS